MWSLRAGPRANDLGEVGLVCGPRGKTPEPVTVGKVGLVCGPRGQVPEGRPPSQGPLGGESSVSTPRAGPRVRDHGEVSLVCRPRGQAPEPVTTGRSV